jgi:hypothetical protein
MLVHRLLDVVFRTLDAIDAVRARVDRALGTEPQPPSTWPPVPDDQPSRAAPPTSSPASSTPTSSSSGATSSSTSSSPADVAARRPRAKKVPASRSVTPRAARTPSSSSTPASRPKGSAAGKKRAPKAQQGGAPAERSEVSERSERARKPVVHKRSAAVSAAAAAAGAAAAARASAATTTTTTAGATSSRPPSSSTTGRKGSVDRSGRDFDSPRARVVEAWLREHQRPIVVEEAVLDGKRTLARAVWALAVAADAGSEQGLTAADASALLWSAAGVEVFATNVGRTLRDEPALFVETIPDGRSKRYKLTDAGRARLAEVLTR